jgi:lysyl-tRNA synthetase class 2
VPSRFYGLKDTDLRYRHRYLDLIANPEVRQTFLLRSRVVAAMRRFLDRRGFVEVETPILVPLAGGASARPFRTHHNAQDMDLSLRISIELHLKRLIVGGLERVYEIGRVFRNEGISTRHNPEFTMLELYQAYADLRDMMALVETMVHDLTVEATGGPVIVYQGQRLDTTPPWPRVSLLEALERASGLDWLSVEGEEGARAAAARLGVAVEAGASRGHILDKLVAHFVEPTLVQPTFLVDHPVEVSPLAKAHPDRPQVADRFEAFVAGRELANAFSELNDPLEQRLRFETQVEERRRTADEEIPDPDEDFLFALEHGMPPTGGLGVGVDRLVMLLADAPSIRDVILFPLLRPEGAPAGASADGGEGDGGGGTWA